MRLDLTLLRSVTAPCHTPDQPSPPQSSPLFSFCRAGTTLAGRAGLGRLVPPGINIVYTESLHQLVLDITADKMKVSYYNYMTKTPSDLEVQLALRQSLYSDD